MAPETEAAPENTQPDSQSKEKSKEPPPDLAQSELPIKAPVKASQPVEELPKPTSKAASAPSQIISETQSSDAEQKPASDSEKVPVEKPSNQPINSEPNLDNAQSSTEATQPTATKGLDIGPDDIVIAVMGETGAGKTTFIQSLTTKKLKIGHTLSSCTLDVDAHSCDAPGLENVWLIDTPGFDDSSKSDAQILTQIASFLTVAYQKQILLTGIIYVHRIQDPRAGNSLLKHISTFKKMCGEGGLSRTALVTTFWNGIDSVNGQRREHELITRSDLWQVISGLGGKSFRFNTEKKEESARAVVEHIVKSKRGKAALALQMEIVEQKLELGATAAGKEVNTQMEEWKEFFRKEVESLKKQLDDIIAKKEEEIKGLKAVLERRQKGFEEKLQMYEADRELFQLKQAELEEQIKERSCAIM